MKTVSLGVENLCVPCHAHCKYCLLSSRGDISGVEYERGKQLAARLFREAKEKRPDLHVFHYIGYCMDCEYLRDYIEFSKVIDSPAAEFLQLNGLELRNEAETEHLVLELIAAGIKLIDLTFYGLREYHDQFAGRKGDFDYLMRILQAAKIKVLNAQISIPVTKENLLQIDELLVRLEEIHSGKIMLFLPHSKGRGRSLSHLRLEIQDLGLLSEKAETKLSGCRTEGEWLADGEFELPARRTLTLALDPTQLDRFESMTLEEILVYLEGLDDRYYASIPSAEELAVLYGKRSGNRLYRRFRDLYLEWQQRYIFEHGLDVWDMNDETHHFSVRT